MANPSWMSSLGTKPFFPRLIENDLYRANLPGLPASRFSVYYSSDHALPSSGNGYIGRVDFDDIEGTWTDSGNYIHAALNQRETPHPVYDPVNNRINVYAHDSHSVQTYGDQATHLLTTTDGATLTDQGELDLAGQHTGYIQATYDADAALWTAHHIIIGGECYQSARSTSANGLSGWTRTQILDPAAQHATSYNNLFDAVPFFFQYGGQWYALSFISARPRNSTNPSKVVIYPVDYDTMRPTGGYYTILNAGTGSDTDVLIPESGWIGSIDGTMYLIYAGSTSGGVRGLHLAKESSTAATQTALSWKVRSSGALHPAQGGTAATTVVDWDATANDLPADVEVKTVNGSNTSSFSSGNYYELKTGSGSVQYLTLRAVDPINPADHYAVDFKLSGLKFKPGVATNLVTTSFGIVEQDGTGLVTNTNGSFCFWGAAGTNPSRPYGQMFHYNATVRTNRDGYVWPFSSSETPNVRDFARTAGIDLTFRVYDYGAKVAVLVDGHVTYTEDVSSYVAWSSTCYPTLVLTNAGSFPEWYARFTAFSVTTYSSSKRKKMMYYNTNKGWRL